MATTVQHDILAVLEASAVPLKALDIARKMCPPRTRKDINQVIYSMKEIERFNPDQNPPLWKIMQSSPAAVVSPTLIHLASSIHPPSEQVPLASAQSAGKALAMSSQHIVHTKHEDGTMIFSPIASKGMEGTMSSASLSTTLIRKSDGTLHHTSNECLAHKSTSQLGDCMTTAISKSGFPNKRMKVSASFNPVALEGDHVTHKSKLVTPNPLVQEVSDLPQEKYLAPPEVDRLPQQLLFGIQEVGNVTHEVEHLVGDMSSKKVDQD